MQDRSGTYEFRAEEGFGGCITVRGTVVERKSWTCLCTRTSPKQHPPSRQAAHRRWNQQSLAPIYHCMSVWSLCLSLEILFPPTASQRRRNMRTSQTSYYVPAELKPALAAGYISPNLPPPRGMRWVMFRTSVAISDSGRLSSASSILGSVKARQ